MRIGIFVDAGNMFHAQREAGWHIDFERVLAYFEQYGEVSEAHYVTASPPFDDTVAVRKHRGFVLYLVRAGYTVAEKEVKTIRDPDTGAHLRKGDLDVNLTLAVLASMPHYDLAVMLTGDSDFEPLVRHLRANGKQVWCVARRQMASVEMLNAANRFVDLETLHIAVERTRKEREPHQR